MYVCILFASVLLGIFEFMFIRVTGLSFFVVSLPGFSIRIVSALWEELRSVLSVSIFWNSLRKIGCMSSIKVCLVLDFFFGNMRDFSLSF